jgi:hypothetical protein
MKKYVIKPEVMGGKRYYMIYVKWFGLFDEFFERCNTPETAAIRLNELKTIKETTILLPTLNKKRGIFKKYFVKSELMGGKRYYMIYVKCFGLFEEFFERCNTFETVTIRLNELTS